MHEQNNFVLQGDPSTLKISSEALFQELSKGINSFQISGTEAKLFQVEEGSTQLK